MSLFLSHLLLVEGKLRSLKNNSITPSTLSRTGCDFGIKTSRCELVVKSSLKSASLLSDSMLGSSTLGGFNVGSSSSLLDSNSNSVVILVPLLERVSIYKNNSSLNEGLGTNQLVIGGIVGDIKDTDLTSAYLSSPREVT